MKFFLCLLFLPLFSYGQGLIVNEISNGAAGNQEYFELVVVGSLSNPAGSVDLGGWIIDDNNGDFEGTATTGIATGHIRIKPGFLSAVKPGSIIVIYNSAELTFANDPTDANSDCVYIIPITDITLDNNNSNPSTTNSIYIPAIYGALQSWSRIGMRNDGDAAQIRKPGGTFFHGFSYGDVLAPFPSLPTELGGSLAFNVITGSGSGRNYFFNCGNFTTASNFSRGSAPTNETPGQPNNDANRYFINSVRNGTYNYANLSDPANCGTATTLSPCLTILPINIIDFRAVKNNNVVVQWEVDNVIDIKYFQLERSVNGYEYQTISEQYPEYLTYSYTDNTIAEQIYYRLKIVEMDGNITYSNIITVNYDITNDVIIYPNPASDIISVRATKTIYNIEIYNEIGAKINLSMINYEINFIDQPKGLYFIKIEVDGATVYRKLVLK